MDIGGENGMDIGALGVLIFLMAFPLFILHIWALIDVLRTPQDVWAAAGQNQLLWGIVVLFFSLIGPILYLVIARPQSVAAESRDG
jgi:uncharacterized paraquat-inducible protein A